MRININKDKKSQRVVVKIKNLSTASKEALKEGFEKMGAGLVRHLENAILNEPKQGREYPQPDGDVHRASAPGQTPALITGEYFEGIFYKPQGARGLIFGNVTEYSEFLELGTDNMEPRPGLGNSITQNLKTNRVYLEESLNKHLGS